MDNPDKADRMFDELRIAIPKPYQKERHCQAWISPETWSLIDTRMEARRQRDQQSSRALSRAIKEKIHGDRHRREDKSGSTVEYLLTSDRPLIREAWIRMQGWYKDAVDRPQPPYIVALATMASERHDIYRHVPLPGETIPVGEPTLLLLVDDSIPEDEDIAWTVRRFCLN